MFQLSGIHYILGVRARGLAFRVWGRVSGVVGLRGWDIRAIGLWGVGASRLHRKGLIRVLYIRFVISGGLAVFQGL